MQRHAQHSQNGHPAVPALQGAEALKKKWDTFESRVKTMKDKQPRSEVHDMNKWSFMMEPEMLKTLTDILTKAKVESQVGKEVTADIHNRVKQSKKVDARTMVRNLFVKA